MPKAGKETGIRLGFRSGLEANTAAQLEKAGIKAEYETHRLTYIKPATPAKYTPDFVLPNGIVIETKGRFTTEDRKKHLLIKQQHPELDIRFVFTRSKARISKTSKTTYAAWCEKHGFLFADTRIPQAWLDEPADQTRCEAIAKAIK